MMIMASICGMNLFTGGVEDLEPSIEELEAIVEDAFNRADRDRSGLISYDEFVMWARSNRDLMAGLETLNKLAMDAKLECVSEDSASEISEGELSDADPAISRGLLGHTGKRAKRHAHISHGDESLPTEEDNNISVSASGTFTKPGATGMQWLGQVFEPTNHVTDSATMRQGSGANLELAWAYGYRSQSSRNNLRYIITDGSAGYSNSTSTVSAKDSNAAAAAGNGAGAAETNAYTNIVYSTASLGVVYNMQDRSQLFYQGHTMEITCMALHPSGLLVATGDTASNIHLWSTQTMACLNIIQGLVKGGVQHLSFSPSTLSGDRLAAVHCDTDSTITLYDSNNGDILASGRCVASPQNVYGLAYAPHSDEIVVVGTKLVKFFVKVQNTKRALEFHLGKIGHQGKKQTFFCVAYLAKNDVVVGCADGSLYRFKHHVCVQIVQAHSINEPILSIFFHPGDSLLITGGKDCNVKSWDVTLKEVGVAIDISEDLDGDGKPDCGAIDASVTSVQYQAGKILVGTKGSDIFEATLATSLNDSLTMNRIGWGHSSGELWGVAFHPVHERFVTVGDDKTLRIWSVRNHEQINLRVLPCASRAVVYNVAGDVLCVGMEDGSVALLDADSSTLRVFHTWNHCAAAITTLCFSGDSKILAVGCADANMYLYRRVDGRNYVRQGVCQGHAGSIKHIDFSANSQFISSSCQKGTLLFWDNRGNAIKDASSFRDETWVTKGVRSNPFGWATQGISIAASQNPNSPDKVNSLCAMPEVGDIVTGDVSGRIKLYRYPCVQAGSLCQTYCGHAGQVACVRVSNNKRYIVSVGKTDRTILLWKHETEIADDSDTDSDNVDDAISYGLGGGRSRFDLPNEVPEIVERSLLQEAMSKNEGPDAINDIIKISYASRGESIPTHKPWQAGIMEPSMLDGGAGEGTTDVDFELTWVHAYRSHDSRNNLKYASSGKIVYAAASLGVILNKSNGKQQFVQAAHTDEIIGIAAHPNGHIFATGEAGRKPIIVIWSAVDCRVVMRIDRAHEQGIPLLAFNSHGNMLASIGMDSCNTLVIHDWANGIEIMRTAVDKGSLFCLTYLVNPHNSDTQQSSGAKNNNKSNDVVVTAGHRHLSYWTNTGQNVKTQRGIWGKYKKETLLCAVSPAPDVVVTGSLTGGLVIWYKYRAQYQAHSQPTPVYNRDDENGPLYPHTDHRNHVGASILTMWAIPGMIDTITPEGHVVNPSNPEATATSTIFSQYRDELIAGYNDTCCRIITGDRNGMIGIWRVVTVDEGGPCTGTAAQIARAQSDDTKCNLRLILMKKINARKLTPTPTHFAIRSVCERDGVLLIGAQGCEIYEVIESSIPFVNAETTESEFADALSNMPPGIPNSVPFSGAAGASEVDATTDLSNTITDTNQIPVPTPAPAAAPKAVEEVPHYIKCERLIAGHGQGELWGLCAHPTLPYFFTAGDDCTVRCWALETQSLVSYLTVPDKSRCLSINPATAGGNILGATGDLAIGFNSGFVWIVPIESFFTTSLGDSLASSVVSVFTGQEFFEPAAPKEGEGEHMAAALKLWRRKPFKKLEQNRAGWKWLQEIKYSFDGRILAVGSHDSNVYLYDVANDYTLMDILKGHDDFITHIDFGVILHKNAKVNQTYDPSSRRIHTVELSPAPSARAGASEVELSTVTLAATESPKVSAPAEAESSDEKKEESENTAVSDAAAPEDAKKDPESTGADPVAPADEVPPAAKVASTPATPSANANTQDLPIQQGPLALRMQDLVILVADGKANLYYYTLKTSTTPASSASPRNVEKIELPKPQNKWRREQNMARLKDTWWGSWSSPYGWPVQGIWGQTYDGTEVNSVARSHSYMEVPVVVTGDNFGRVRLFNYPSLVPGSPDKCYRGHCGHITRVVFSHNDRFCITIGGEDRAIFVWSTDILEEIRERRALAADTLQKSSSFALQGTAAASMLGANESQSVADMELDAENNSLVPVKNLNSKAMLTLGAAAASGGPGAGDENMSVKPWKGAVREPSGWKEPDSLGEAPEASLEMKFVYGYRGWDCRNNIGFAGSRHLITYHIAAVGIVFNTQTHTQIHNTEHNNDIICLDVHPDGHMVATGELCKKPVIVLWDAYTGVTIRVLKYHTRGVSNVSFSKSGALLISVGMDSDHMIAVHNVNTGALVGKGKAGKGVDVLTISVGYGESPDLERFVSGGKGHIKFWELPSAAAAGGELSCKGGIYNNKAIKCRSVVSSAFLSSDCVTGMSDGTMVLWKERCATRFVNAHKGAVMALCELGGRGSIGSSGTADTGGGSRIISGGKDGCIHIWSYKLAKIWSLDLGSPDTYPMSVNAHIRAVSTYENRLLVGTKGSEIYEINLLTNTVSSSSGGNSGTTSSIYRLVEGHYDDRAEVWALATHPIAGTNKFVTGGDDMTVRVYDSNAMRQIAMVNVGKKVRAIAWRPDGSHIAIGCYDGRVKILTADLQTLVAEEAPTSKWISCLSYSPDGQHLVVGSHDTQIYLLDTKSYSVRTVFAGNSGAVTQLDWSEDNSTIQSASAAYELLFWSARDGRQIKGATSVRDVRWKSWTSILGWPVQGIWPSGADFSDVNSCDRSPNQKLLATADDNHRIKLFAYPVPKEGSQCKEYKGHSEHVPTVRFSGDGQFVFSVGGLDKAVIQYQVKQSRK